MTSSVRVVIASFGCMLLLAGCGGGNSKDPKIAAVGGSVTYKGAPVAGATVTFMPDKGPLAIGITDLNGEFKLNSGALVGCAVGPVKVAVRVEAPGESSNNSVPKPGSGDFAEQSKKMADMTMAHQQSASTTKKSLIPEKYRDPTSSGLTYTVEADASKNKFKIELQD